MHAARNAVREVDDRYKRHQPELTLLYQIIETYYPEFLAYMESQGKILPTHIKKEFDAYLKCGRLEQGFLRVRCEECHHERLVAFSCKNVVSVPAVVQDGWLKALLCSLMKYCLTSLYDSGLSAFLFNCAICLPDIQKQ